MTKRDYHSNPSQEDKTITNNDTVSSALAKLKACAPGNAYVQINDNVFKVNSVSWSQTSKSKVKIKKMVDFHSFWRIRYEYKN